MDTATSPTIRRAGTATIPGGIAGLGGDVRRTARTGFPGPETATVHRSPDPQVAGVNRGTPTTRGLPGGMPARIRWGPRRSRWNRAFPDFRRPVPHRIPLGSARYPLGSARYPLRPARRCTATLVRSVRCPVATRRRAAGRCRSGVSGRVTECHRVATRSVVRRCRRPDRESLVRERRGYHPPGLRRGRVLPVGWVLPVVRVPPGLRRALPPRCPRPARV